MSIVISDKSADKPATKPRRGADDGANVAPLANNMAGELVQLFKLLADETRLQILYFLMQRDELNVGTLCRLLHQSQPAVSHHLALLRTSKLIDMRREGKHNYYRLVPQRFQELRANFVPIVPSLGRLFSPEIGF